MQRNIARKKELTWHLFIQKKKNFFFTSLADGRFWIGGNDISTEDSWVWSDGSDWNFTNWNRGEPNNWNKEDCLQANGIWNDVSCEKFEKFVCKKQKTNPTSTNGKTF